MKDTDTKQRFIELRAKGLSFDKISDKLNTSKQTLINWQSEFNAEIANLKAVLKESKQRSEKRLELRLNLRRTMRRRLVTR